MPLDSTVKIYTDGACKGNPGPGGYGAVLLQGGVRKELSGGRRSTTNNRMELLALVAALEALDASVGQLCVCSDSQYLIGGFKKGWVRNWKRNGWLTASKQPVQNRDLWMKLDELLAGRRAEFQWVRGHASTPENNRCDELAVRASHAKSLPPDEGYENAPAPFKQEFKPRPANMEKDVQARPSPKKLKPSPTSWDGDLFSKASEPVNWDL